MDNYCAPQWVDFTCSPQVPSDDYFEKNHEIYEPKLCTKVIEENINSDNELSEIIETPRKSVQSLNEYSIKSVSTENLETEISNIKNTPIKIIYPSPYNNSKPKIMKQISYDNILNKAVQLCEEFINDKKDTKVSSTEDIFKKPMPVKMKTFKPVRIREIENSFSESTDKEMQDAASNILAEETNNISVSGVNMFKRGTSSWKKVMKDVGKTSKTDDHLKCTISENNILKNDRSKINLDSKSLKLKSSNLEQQSSLVNKYTIPKVNTRNRPVVTNNQEKSKPKQVEKDQNKTKFLRSNSTGSSSVLHNKSTQKNIRVTGTDSTVKVKQTPRLYSSFSKEGKILSQKNNASKKMATTVVGNIGSEIIIKKEKILFFDIPIHTKQKKITCPIPFSFENRDKMKKQLKLGQSESKSKSVPNLKLLDFNKSQRVMNKLPNTKKNTFRSFSSNNDINEKMKDTKQLERSKNTSTAYLHSSLPYKPMKTINSMKNKIEKKKIPDSQNKKDANQIKKPLAPISCKNIQININLKNNKQEALEINKKCIEKENKQPNTYSFVTNTSTLNQSKVIKSKSSVIKTNIERKEKQRNILEEKIKEKRTLLEEKLKKEKEEKEAKEKLEIAKLRKQTEIKARPMPVYKPLIRIKSTKPLTKPQSPAWSSKKKVKSTL
ncbi:calponin homology domain-containing protein DDB_G0272472-like [Polistes fuscatus]|uniref:calponin homology domain-containing protein DDB_G0272472-like n=1 Tax=Polistes fuscatus TaxID=30207 RepID=UPI001CAA3F0E|nr:calponin homology domain-containing protein DDB_G0272472-like [Polistes fuscatus]